MFDRVVCINLDRRPERWAAFQKRLPAPWPFGPVERVAGVDGLTANIPPWYSNRKPRLRGAWGCYRTHLRIWQHAVENDLASVLVFEDDAIFCEEFSERVMRFLAHVPNDWSQLYLGGQHLNTHHSLPQGLNDEVLACFNVNRTHAYAMRRPMLEAMYKKFSKPWKARNRQHWHIDFQLGFEHIKGTWKVYAPTRFLVGQVKGDSDVARKMIRTNWWNGFSVC